MLGLRDVWKEVFTSHNRYFRVYAASSRHRASFYVLVHKVKEDANSQKYKSLYLFK